MYVYEPTVTSKVVFKEYKVYEVINSNMLRYFDGHITITINNITSPQFLKKVALCKYP